MSDVDELRRIWLFEGLTEDQLGSLSPFTYRKKFGPGELIVEEGHTGNGLYLIVSGNVEAIKGLGTEGQQTVNKLGAGEVFGEMALLGEWPRTASVRAVDDVECLGIDRWVFLAQLERQPKVGIRMLHILAQKLRDSDARLVE